MKKTTLVGGCFALLGWGAVQAATQFPDGLVPMELVREFGAGGQIYSSLPDDFPLTSLNLDLDLQVIGSVQPAHGHSRVLLRSDTSAAGIAEALAPALLQSGWLVMNSAANASLRFAYLCHDQLGSLSLMARDVPQDGARLSISLDSLPANAARQNCAAMKELQEQSNALRAFLVDQFPELTLPDGSPIAGLGGSPGFVGIVGIGSGFDMQRQSIVQVPGSSTVDLYEHFATQLEEQGWAQDSGGAGELTAGGFWARNASVESDDAPGGAVRLLTSLTLIDRGEDVHEIKLAVRAGEGCNPFQSAIGTDCTVRDFPGIAGYRPPINTPQLGIRGLPPGYGGGVPVPYNTFGAVVAP